MKILVPIKQIQDPAGLMINRKAGKVFVNREEYVMNPASKRALEAALRLKDFREAVVIVAGFGSADSADCLREARAMGADRAILIPTGLINSAVAVRALVALANHLGGVDLFILGNRTLDTGVSSGAWLAEALGWPFLGEAVDVSVEGNTVRIVRREDAANAYEADLPAIVTVTREGPKPRYPHGGKITTIYRDTNAVETITPAELGLADSDLQPVTAERGQSFPPEREFGRQVMLEEVAGVLKNRD